MDVELEEIVWLPSRAGSGREGLRLWWHGRQDRHAEATPSRVWKISAWFCCILEEWLLKMEGHGKRFPVQGKGQYQCRHLLHRGEPERERGNSWTMAVRSKRQCAYMARATTTFPYYNPRDQFATRT